MNEMVERVARGICKREERSEQRWSTFVDHARAAIAAMREPTEVMFAAVQAHTGFPSDEYRNAWLAGAYDGWQAMINEALK